MAQKPKDPRFLNWICNIGFRVKQHHKISRRGGNRSKMRFKCGFRNFVSPVWVLSNTYALQQVAHRSLLPSVLFDWQVPEGRCVGLKFPNLPSDHPYSLGNVIHDEHHWIRRALHPQEIEYGLTQTTPARQHSFWMGRLAMHQLLIGEQICILKDSYGRPIMPHGWYGSISHKENTAVALISQTRRVGVDLETTRRKRTNIARRILTPNEANDLGNIQVR